MEGCRIRFPDKMIKAVAKAQKGHQKSERESTFAYWVREAVGEKFKIPKENRHDDPR